MGEVPTAPGSRPGPLASPVVPDELWPSAERPAFRHRVGLRPLDPSRWVVVDGLLGPVLDAKVALLASGPDEVLLAEPGTDAAGRELLELLLVHLAADHTATHAVGTDVVEVAGRVVPLDVPGRSALDTAGRLVQDDWCLLDDGGDEVRLVAATLCSPSRWRLADKLRRGMPEVHAPVPGYPEQLASTVDATLRRLTPARSVWRSNWTLTDDADLFQPTVGPPQEVRSPSEAAETVWLRLERQTLRRLPRTGAVVFGIRTFQQPLVALAGRPVEAAGLLGAVRQLPDDMVRYKSLTTYRVWIEAWLARCSA